MAACFYKKALAVSSAALSVVSTIVSFVPFIAIYYIIQALVLHMNSLDTLNGSYMVRLAGCGAIAAVFLNFVALMCSHLAAFKTLYQLKLAFTQHIASLPLGFHTANSTGKLRKIVDENIEKIEGFIAHQFPAMICSFTTPIVALVILFLFDWRMGLGCLIPLISGEAMGGIRQQLRFTTGAWLWHYFVFSLFRWR
jgi:ABC-type multidrug transport system, ATPase and permease components